MSEVAPLAATRRLVTALRPGRHDLTTEAGRSAERYRRAALATVVSVIARGLNIVTLFVGMRLAASTTSANEFGLWLLLVTAISLVGFADFGIGNGVLNVISGAKGRDDQELIRQAVASAVTALTVLALGCGAVFALVQPHIDWATVLNVSGPAADETGRAVTAFVGLILISLPLGIAQRVHHAEQEGWVANAWLAVGSGISLIAIGIATATDAGVTAQVGAMLIGAPLAFLADSIILFGWSRTDLRPRLRNITRSATGRVLRHGFLFFVLATVIAVSYESDTLIISHYLGADQVQNYAVPFRLFALAPTFVMILLTPLWPAYGEAVARNDLSWVHRTLRRTLVVGAVVPLPVSIGLLLVGPFLIELWVGPTVQPSFAVMAGIAVWAVITGISTAVAMFLNGVGILRLQVVMALAMCAANVALSIALVQRIGIAGPIWATVVTQIVFVLGPAWFLMHGFVSRRGDAEEIHRFLRRWSDPSARPGEAAGSATHDGVTP